MQISDEMLKAARTAALPQISEGVGAILRKFCDSPQALQARRVLHDMPPSDWTTFCGMLADAAADAALEAVAPMIRADALEEAAKVAEQKFKIDELRFIQGFSDEIEEHLETAGDEIAAAIRAMKEPGE